MRAPAAARTRMRWTCCPAARATPLATFLPMATFIPACSFLCPAETCGARSFVDIWRDSPQLKEVRSITPARYAVLLRVRAWRDLHALPGPGLPGGQYARAFVPGLREILRAHRNSQRKLQGEARGLPVVSIPKPGSDSRFAAGRPASSVRRSRSQSGGRVEVFRFSPFLLLIVRKPAETFSVNPVVDSYRRAEHFHVGRIVGRGTFACTQKNAGGTPALRGNLNAARKGRDPGFKVTGSRRFHSFAGGSVQPIVYCNADCVSFTAVLAVNAPK